MAAGKCCGIDDGPRERYVNGGTLYPPPPPAHRCDPPGGFWYGLWNGPIHTGQRWRCDCGMLYVMERHTSPKGGNSYRMWKCLGFEEKKP